MAFVISVVSSFLILRFIKRMKDGHGDGINFTEFAPKSRLAMTKLSMTASLWVFSDEFCSNCRIRNEHWAHGRKLFIGLVFSPFASMLDILSTWTSDHLGENSQVLEIVMSTPGVFEVLQQLVHIYPTRVLGVGTILNIEDAERAVIAGAKFFMSPVKVKEADGTTEETKKSSNLLRKLEKRQKDRTLDSHIEEQFSGGRLLACISSRPGQCGRFDGYILEGKELEFYMKKLQRKKGKAAGAAA